jgi:hypothetical protein
MVTLVPLGIVPGRIDTYETVADAPAVVSRGAAKGPDTNAGEWVRCAAMGAAGATESVEQEADISTPTQ